MKLRGLFLALALFQPIERVDRDLVQEVQSWRQPWLDPVMGEISGAGRPLVVLSGLAAIAVFDRAAGLRTALATLIVLAPVNLVVEGLKRAIGRPRPDGERKRSNSSFPSSHAANAVALAWMLGRRWPRLAIPFGVAAALVVFSRIYLNRHFPSDLVVGVAIGLGLALLSTRRFPALDPRRDMGIEGPASKSTT